MLEKIYQSSPNFEYINTSYFDFNGATVEGELRELCKLETSNGFALRKLDKKHFINCLPNQLKSQGYETIALHGTSGRLYDRYDWYPKAGFNQSLFGENFTSLQRCSAFNGICDSELINVVADKFSENRNNKLFFYWLTLTSHSPYVKEDITNNRFNCQQFGMKPEGDICRNAKLETQFLDNLAKLVLRPEMKGVEVVIVGDHMPPLFGNEEIYPYLRWQDVSWLHFKVKD
ncbi:MAG: sulfatase-like hydrolase/transferase [Negativicutes bacterium]|nr:sulfatase-like hydrolase/transferase [Negativicutes bacterium]